MGAVGVKRSTTMACCGSRNNSGLQHDYKSWKAELFEYDTQALMDDGIDITANEYTAMVHFRGSW